MSDPRDKAAKEDDLRATEDSIRADLGRLAALETAKSTLAPDSPEVDHISDQAVEIADDIARKARAERQLGRDLA